MLMKMHRKVLKTSKLAYTMLLVQGLILPPKNMAFYIPIGCVRFARYCGRNGLQLEKVDQFFHCQVLLLFLGNLLKLIMVFLHLEQ